MKKTVISSLLGVMLVSAAMFAGSCEKEGEAVADNSVAAILDVKSDGSTFINEDVLCANYVETPELTQEELDMLLYMKDEEKLARDVYYALYDAWGALPFSNISKAEEQHMNAVISLLELYGSEETLVKDPGQFDDIAFETLYAELVAQGSASVEEAFKVGALIEELDIWDLQEHLEAASNPNITLVFSNLMKGSRNHLRAFNRQLVRLNIDYAPQYITQEEYDEIVNSGIEAGRVF